MDKANPYLLKENIQRALTNFYVDFAWDKDILADILTAIEEGLGMFVGLFSQISGNVSLDSTEICRSIPFAVVSVPDAIISFYAKNLEMSLWNDGKEWNDNNIWQEYAIFYNASTNSLLPWNHLSMKDKISALIRAKAYIEMNSSRPWDKKKNPILHARIGYDFSPDTLMPSEWLLANEDYIIYDNKLFIFPSGIGKIGKKQLYCYDIYVDYGKVQQYADPIGMTNDLMFTKHYYRELVGIASRLFNIGLDFKTAKMIAEQMPGWEYVEMYDIYNATDDVRHFWENETLNLTKFDFILYGQLSRDACANYKVIVAFKNIINAVKSAHTAFELILSGRMNERKGFRENFEVVFRNVDLENQTFFDNKGYQDLSSVTGVPFAGEQRTHADSLELSGQNITLTEERGYNNKVEFIFDSEYAMFFDDITRADMIMDRELIAVGPSDYFEVLYFEP